MQGRRGQRSRTTTSTDDEDGEDDDDDYVWQTLLQLEHDITRDQPWNSQYILIHFDASLLLGVLTSPSQATTLAVTTGAALPENNEASAELTAANGRTFLSCSARLSSQSRYRSLDQ